MYVCIYMYIQTYTHACMYIHMYIYIYIYTHVFFAELGFRLEVDAVVQDRFRKMVRFKRVPGGSLRAVLRAPQNSYVLVLRPRTTGIQKPWFVRCLCMWLLGRLFRRLKSSLKLLRARRSQRTTQRGGLPGPGVHGQASRMQSVLMARVSAFQDSIGPC